MIKAQLDQLTSSVDFDVQPESKGVQVAGGQGASAVNADGEAEQAPMMTAPDRELGDFNKQIHQVCSNIDGLISDILKQHPQLSQLDQ